MWNLEILRNELVLELQTKLQMIFKHFVEIIKNIKYSALNLLDSIREIDSKFKVENIPDPKDGQLIKESYQRQI